MSNAIILHGTCGRDEWYDTQYPCGSNFHWLPWLQKQLLVKDIFAVTPQMPDAWMPDYDVWKKEFEKHEVSDQTILVGHSCGGGFLVKWLNENQAKVGKVVLVAPWIDPDNDKDNGFFDGLVLDPELTSKTNGITIMSSTDDAKDIHNSEQRILKEVEGVKYIEFQGYSHFNKPEIQQGFPELLQECLN